MKNTFWVIIVLSITFMSFKVNAVNTRICKLGETCSIVHMDYEEHIQVPVRQEDGTVYVCHFQRIQGQETTIRTMPDERKSIRGFSFPSQGTYLCDLFDLNSSDILIKGNFTKEKGIIDISALYSIYPYETTVRCKPLIDIDKKTI